MAALRCPPERTIVTISRCGGAVSCSCCGYALTGGWSKGKTKRYAYYFCHHHGCEMRGEDDPRCEGA